MKIPTLEELIPNEDTRAILQEFCAITDPGRKTDELFRLARGEAVELLFMFVAHARCLTVERLFLLRLAASLPEGEAQSALAAREALLGQFANNVRDFADLMVEKLANHDCRALGPTDEFFARLDAFAMTGVFK